MDLHLLTGPGAAFGSAAGGRHHAGRGDTGRAGTGRAGTGRPDAGSVPLTLALVTVLLVVGLGVGWRLDGGGWAVIQTPSMGTAAPVGTLVLTRSAALSTLEVGDVVTYRPSDAHDRLYTHRVVAREPDGALRVRGDVNGAADPLPVRQADLVGKVVASWRGVGWLVRALPTVLLALVVLLVGTGLYVPDRWRSSVRIVGTCLVFALSALVLRPFVHPVLIAVSDTHDGPVASVISGGLFPTRITGSPGHSIVLTSGQAGTVPVLPARPGGPVLVNGHPDLHGGWLLAMIGVCLLPLIWSLTVGLTPVEPTGPAEIPADDTDDADDVPPGTSRTPGHVPADARTTASS